MKFEWYSIRPGSELGSILLIAIPNSFAELIHGRTTMDDVWRQPDSKLSLNSFMVGETMDDIGRQPDSKVNRSAKGGARSQRSYICIHYVSGRQTASLIT